ncbi:hypothetical protein ABPG77_009657 [Micractinium sp. CCAP 211/92]
MLWLAGWGSTKAGAQPGAFDRGGGAGGGGGCQQTAGPGAIGTACDPCAIASRVKSAGDKADATAYGKARGRKGHQHEQHLEWENTAACREGRRCQPAGRSSMSGRLLST